MKSYHLVHSESPPPISLDPIDSDYGNNLHASQMLHRTLLEVTNDNLLSSGVLRSFKYEPEKAEIQFEIDETAKFSDGSRITSEDVAITIKRMALKRPNFPVLKHIRGLSQWLATEKPLTQSLDGLIVEQNRLRIQLVHNINNPLFRFALPLFGIVKADCVDAVTNKIAAGCPTSGYYRLKKQENSSLVFAIANPSVHRTEQWLPDELILDYQSRPAQSKDLEQLKNGSFVVLTQQYSMSTADERAQAQLGFSRIEQANSRFSSFLLNPKMEAFSSASCRRIFAEKLRSNIESSPDSYQPEYSLFSRILPGFLTREELRAGAPKINDAEVRRCLKGLKGKTLRWMPGVSNNAGSFTLPLEKTAVELGMKLETLAPISQKAQFDAFLSNGLDILLGGSGFWAFDPVGDVQMLLTKGLHKPLAFVSADPQIESLLDGLEFSIEPSPRLKLLNQYIYDQALLNVYSHSKRVYLTKGPAVAENIPVSISPPAPWQMFRAGAK